MHNNNRLFYSIVKETDLQTSKYPVTSFSINDLMAAFQNGKRITFSSRVILLSTLSILVAGALSSMHNSYAMGPGPGGCSSYDTNGREYDATITSFEISNGKKTIDVLANPSAIINVDVTSGYTTTVTLHALNTGTLYDNGHYSKTTFGDSKTGSVWLNTDLARNYSQSVCHSGLIIGGDRTITETHTFDQMQPHYDLPDTQQVHYLTTKSSASYSVKWVDSTDAIGTSHLKVKSVDNFGNPIYGYYTVLSSGGHTISTGFTTARFNLDSGMSYVVEVEDYGDYVFDHWKGSGSTFRAQGISITSDTTMTAVYRLK